MWSMLDNIIAHTVPARLQPTARQMGRFVVVGLVNTAVGYLAYIALLNVVGLPRAWALVGSYVGGVTFAFFSFGKLVFGNGQGLSSATAMRFVLGYLVLYGLNLAMLEGLVLGLHWSEEASQAVLLPVVAFLSYLINRFFIFRVTPK